ncbi:MAG: proton-conducting transporter transmembrane domain-containing protein [Vulcanimicrobiaceae bacterium]
MTTTIVALPALAFPLAAAMRSRSVRCSARVLFALTTLAATALAAPHMDGLSAVFALLISFLCSVVVVFSTGILPKAGEASAAPWSTKPAYFMLLGAFWSSMLLAVTSAGFIGLWTGISATTLATTFLVGYGGSKAALEAAWKYLMLCSFGIAIALVGMLFLGRAAMGAHVAPNEALSWQALIAHAQLLPAPLTRVALILMLVGFATKAGLVPMHAWLPDVHSKAPASVSALLSGLLVSCALYAIMRVQSVAAHTAAASLFDAILLYGGALSILIASLLMLAQRDVKRLLSYSTVEHAGIVAVALGLATPLAAFAALYHVLNHALGKSLAFLSVGVVQDARRGGRALLAALLGLAGLPPFGLFVSELLIIFAAVKSRQWIVLGIALFGLLIAFAALLRLAIATQSGSATPAHRTDDVQRGSQSMPAIALGAVALTASASFALTFVPFVTFGRMLYAFAVTIVGGS